MTTLQVRDKEAFQDLQIKYAEKMQYLRQAMGRLQSLQQEKRHKELTLKELENAPKNTVSYRAVGKLFIQSPLPDLQSNISETIAMAQEDIIKLEQQVKLLQANLKELERSIKDLMIV